MELILASSSASRKMLLERFGLPFQAISPDIDEHPLPGEDTTALIKRLSLEKAEVIAKDHPEACIIAGDQLIAVGDRLMGKPHTLDRAKEQLRYCSGKTITAHAGLAVKAPDKTFETIVLTHVTFKTLSDALIDYYLSLDNVLSCAGSIQAEAAGPLLFKSVESEDPTAIIGLPLIELGNFLTQCGFFPN